MSKLVVAVTEQADLQSADWSRYLDEQLLVENGDTFHANLYPLARGSFSKRLPSQYQALFYIGEWYPSDVLKIRFDILYLAWTEYRPRVTFCFGKCEWPTFEQLLKLKAEPMRRSIDAECILPV